MSCGFIYLTMGNRIVTSCSICPETNHFLFSCNVGIAVYPYDSIDYDALLHKARPETLFFRVRRMDSGEKQKIPQPDRYGTRSEGFSIFPVRSEPALKIYFAAISAFNFSVSIGRILFKSPTTP